jgi:hypothetical protein
MIARESDSESVRLMAFRAIVTDEMAVSKYSELQARVAEIETQLGNRPRVPESGKEKMFLNSVSTSAR